MTSHAQSLNLVEGDNMPVGAFFVGQILGLALKGNQITNLSGAPGLTVYYDRI